MRIHTALAVALNLALGLNAYADVAPSDLAAAMSLPDSLTGVEQAPTPPASSLPTAAQAALSADQQPTPLPTIAAAINALHPRVGDVFVDFGCGPDARACIVAARDCGLDAIGVEIDPAVAESARRYVAQAGLSHKVTIITADATKIDVPSATIGFAYLWPDTLEALAPKLAKLRAFASFAHPVPGLATRQVGDLFVYEKPTLINTNQHQSTLVRNSVATWNGRQYTSPVCSRPGCSMCAAIRSQLATPRYQTVTVAAPPDSARRQAAPAGAEPRYEMRTVQQRVCWFDARGRKHCGVQNVQVRVRVE
jgi:hypothetical protein